MKSEQINTFLSEISGAGLSPNEYVCLFLFVQGKSDIKLNCDMYKKKLILKGWLDMQGKPTNKVTETGIFEDIEVQENTNDFDENVEKYRLMWPSLLLPSGKYARSTSIAIRPKFEWFFQTFEFNWDTVFAATEDYIRYYQQQNYIYMQTSSYFIYKQDLAKIRTSTLAEWCEKVGSDEHNNDSFDINV